MPGDKLMFVGGGINDALVLTRADIGVAMGGLGSDAAIKAADVVLMTDEPSKLVRAMKIAKQTKCVVWQNIILALFVKGIVLILGICGLATIWDNIAIKKVTGNVTVFIKIPNLVLVIAHIYYNSIYSQYVFSFYTI